MTLKKKVKVSNVAEKVETKTEGNEKWRKASDEYKPEFDPMRMIVHEYVHPKDGKTVKDYLEFKCTRFGEDGLPYVFVTMYRESDFYTGYLKGKTIYFPIEMLYDVIATFEEFSEECESHGL